MTSERLDLRPAHRPGVTTEVIDSQTVLRRTSTGRAYQLNATMLALWELCDGETSVTEMLGAMAELFDAAPGQLEQDVLDALDRLAHDDLILLHRE